MEWLSPWIPTLVVFALFVLSVWREPRSLLPGVLLVGTIQLAAVVLLRDTLVAAARWGGELAPAWILLGLLLAAVSTVSLLGLFLTVNAVTMFRKEGPAPATLASAAVGVGIVGYVALLVIAFTRPTGDLAVTALLLGLPLGYLGWLFTVFVSYSLLYGWAARRWGGPVDAVIVLGSGLRDGHHVTPLLASRLDRGRRVYERSRGAGRDTTLVVSGGRGTDEEVPEAEAMRRHLVAQGVDEWRVHSENRSTTTEENLRFSSALLREIDVPGRVAVVTSDYHAFRAATLMRKTGIAGYAVGARTARYFWPSATVREYVALLRDHLLLNTVLLGLLSFPVIARVITELAGLLQ